MLVSQDYTDSLAGEVIFQYSRTSQVDSEQMCYFHETSIYCAPTKCQALF